MDASTTFMRRSATASTLAEAWAFVMGEVDRFERPSIEIRAMTHYTPGEPSVEVFDVTVFGMVSAGVWASVASSP